MKKKEISILEKVYKLGWIGVMEDIKNVDKEMIYENKERGFEMW